MPISPRTIDVLDFDDSRNWTSLLTAALADLVSETFVETLVTAAPEFVEDALDLLLAHTDRERVVDAAVGWISLDHRRRLSRHALDRCRR